VIDAATNLAVVFFGIALLFAMVWHAGGAEARRFARPLTMHRSAVSRSIDFDTC
jgi:hypothetical protein